MTNTPFIAHQGRPSPHCAGGVQRLVRPLAELGNFLRSWIFDLRQRSDIPNLMDAEAAEQIVTEVVAERAQFAQAAYTARVADDEGLALIDRVLADGKVTPAELPLLRRARRHVARSRDIDHDLSEESA